ncbi:MAG: hypothetical protein V2J89_03285, partial [Halieaceae bacterium]|jgi:hypothetical protein|nr:hypothetical protein [Halieaceae bacterium]
MAESLDTSLKLTPGFFSMDVREGSQDGMEEARFNSGLGLGLRNNLVELALDYRVESQLHEETADAEVSQQLGAAIYSSALNDILGVNADIRAGSVIRDAGDAFEYSIRPGISKSLADIAELRLQYEYLLDRPAAEAEAQERVGYYMGLNGASPGGLLTWNGRYRSTEVFGGVEQLQSIELLEFATSLQLAPDLELQLSGRSMDEIHFEAGLENALYNQTRYGAGLAWAPSRFYSLAFKVNKLDESRLQEQDALFGSGSLSWYPQRNMAFTLSYGDQLVEGSRGLMLSTRIDLDRI